MSPISCWTLARYWSAAMTPGSPRRAPCSLSQWVWVTGFAPRKRGSPARNAVSRPDPAAGRGKVDRQDVRFTHDGDLEAEEIRVTGLLGRDQVNLRTA